jgi:[ribosomal protein S5]-alanine N-acetyltransferase
MPEPSVVFARLPEIDTDAVTALLNEPRNARHMPLLGEPFSAEATVRWVQDKDAQWEANGYGPWAILIDGEFAGWGGFQAEPDGADFALVLHPRFWGRGRLVARRALDHAFDEWGLDHVLIALPLTRTADRVVERWGFEPAGETSFEGIPFRRYRLERRRWRESGL